MKIINVIVLVEPDFVPTELSLVQDVFRIANRLSQTFTFSIQHCTSSTNEMVEGLGGLLVKAKSVTSVSTEVPDHFIVLGGPGLQNKHNFEKPRAWIRHFERKGCRVVLLSDAALEWKRHNPDDRDVTTHWEDQQWMRDTHQVGRTTLPLYSHNNRLTSAAGMMATADVILNTIVAPLSVVLAQGVSHVLLMPAIRAHDVDQPRSENDITLLQQAGLGRVIQLMEENLETPLSISLLAEMSGCSQRQLERRFQNVVSCGPNSFYRSLRLKRGKALLEHTAMSITEIAISLGFSSNSSFSRPYAREYGITPSRARALMERN
ncbi:GlxA family transcriptional regulator [Leucothrix arctica]|nr:helix-turn-helix domain-containing protein [Leucothrix arctica]